MMKPVSTSMVPAERPPTTSNQRYDQYRTAIELLASLTQRTRLNPQAIRPTPSSPEHVVPSGAPARHPKNPKRIADAIVDAK